MSAHLSETLQIREQRNECNESWFFLIFLNKERVKRLFARRLDKRLESNGKWILNEQKILWNNCILNFR